MKSLANDGTPVRSDEDFDALRGHMVALIAPFFDPDQRNDQTVARDAALQLLLGFRAVTGKELQLAAQIVAFGTAALDCLHCTMAETDLPERVLSRIQKDAVTLNSLAEKSRNELQARQREREHGRTAPAGLPGLDAAEVQAAIDEAWRMAEFARAKLEAHRVGKALIASVAGSASTTISGQAVPSRSVMARGTARPMTPDVLARRRHAAQLWPNDHGGCTGPDGQTKH